MHYASSFSLALFAEPQQNVPIESVQSARAHRQWLWQRLGKTPVERYRLKLLFVETFKEAFKP